MMLAKAGDIDTAVRFLFKRGLSLLAVSDKNGCNHDYRNMAGSRKPRADGQYGPLYLRQCGQIYF